MLARHHWVVYTRGIHDSHSFKSLIIQTYSKTLHYRCELSVCTNKILKNFLQILDISKVILFRSFSDLAFGNTSTSLYKFFSSRELIWNIRHLCCLFICQRRIH